MKKFTKCFCIILLFFCFPLSSLAEAPQDMVYAPPQVQDYLYDLIQTELESEEYSSIKKRMIENNCKIVKESIAPLYELDLLEYARSGNIKIVPYSQRNHERDVLFQCYVAKVVMPNGEFAGNLKFFVKDGKAIFDILNKGYELDVSNREHYRQYTISYDYADHAERIRKILDRDDYVSVTDVKAVYVPCYGHVFWIDNGSGFPIIIPCNFEPNVNHKDYDYESAKNLTDTIITESELYATAKNELSLYEDYFEQVERWESEHPGETAQFFGYIYGRLSPQPLLCSEVDNISNVYEYLGINPDDYRGELDLGIFEISEAPSESTESDTSESSESSVESILSDDANISDSSEPTQKNDGKVGIWVTAAGGILLLVGGLIFVKTRKK